MILSVIALTALIALLVGGSVAYRLRERPALSRWVIALLATGAAFIGPWLALIGALLAALYESWPISLRQGPDTDHALACFERRLRGPRPIDVEDVYCREEWGFGGDSIYSVRFSFSDRASIEALARRMELQRVADPARPGFRHLDSSSWWPAEAELRALPEAYGSGDREYLWIDPTARIAYYQRAGF